jgi:hypothetical protein
LALILRVHNRQSYTDCFQESGRKIRQTDQAIHSASASGTHALRQTCRERHAGPDRAALEELCRELEFHRLLREIPLLAAVTLSAAPAAWFGFDTAQSPTIFWAQQLGLAILICLGGAIGLAGAFALTRYLESLLFGVQRHDAPVG